MMEHKWSPVSIEQGSLTSLTPKRHKAGLSMSPKERKDKVGERIAALQQLVSPYGKTDTASVLYEAIQYISFLHDQVKVLSAPYLHNNPTSQSQECESYNLKGKGCVWSRCRIRWELLAAMEQISGLQSIPVLQNLRVLLCRYIMHLGKASWQAYK